MVSRIGITLAASAILAQTICGQSAIAEMSCGNFSASWTVKYVGDNNSQTARTADPSALAQQPAQSKQVAVKKDDCPAIFQAKKNVTAPFQAEIHGDAEQLPLQWKKRLAAAGYRISITRTLAEGVPAADGKQVRGYKSTATWNQVFGMFDRSTRRVVMAELAAQTQQKNSALVPLNDKTTRAGILRHEFGHAIDDYLHYYSHTPKFAAAYAKGLIRLSANDKQILQYYLQPGTAGKEETFAELFAADAGDACDSRADNLLRAKFPEALDAIHKAVL